MIGYQDFAPVMLKKGGLFSVPEMSELKESLKQANEWIDKHHVNVINVETVVLPNIHRRGEEGGEDPQLYTAGEQGSLWYQLIRVWYDY